MKFISSLARALLRIVILSLIIVMPHELGHYAAMRLCGVRVVRIAIGFGPSLWSHMLSNGVEIDLKPILLGGYTEPAVTGPHNITTASPLQMLFIMMAGMFVNACLAFVAFCIMNRMSRKYLGRLYPVTQGDNLQSVPKQLSGAFKESFVAWLRYPWDATTEFIDVWRAPEKLSPEVEAALDRLDAVEATESAEESTPETQTENCDDCKCETEAPPAEPKVVSAEAERPPFLLEMVGLFAIYNVLLAGFNFMPFIPLDGGRVAAVLIEQTLGLHAAIWWATYSLYIGLGLWWLKGFGTRRKYKRRKAARQKK